MRKIMTTIFLGMLAYTNAFALPNITLFDTKYGNENIPVANISRLIHGYMDVSSFREVKAQVIYNAKREPDHLILYCFSKRYHRVDVTRFDVDPGITQVFRIKEHYRLRQDDFEQQPGILQQEAKCPDQGVQFIAFAPNSIPIEQEVTQDVLNKANAHGLKAKPLIKAEATRTNYLNYMACPHLKGNFYNGDANPDLITAVDGVISYKDIDTQLRNQFRFKVTNIWLACEAYNNPIKHSLIHTAQSQKYAAGKNNLLVGPSDRAAACAMKQALDGQPMTASFNDCYKKLDTHVDKWGFSGKGSDIFGA